MSMGIGKRYWVRMLKHTDGTLEECIKFMEENKPKTNKQWFELHPIVKVKTSTCSEYMCDLVEMAK